MTLWIYHRLLIHALPVLLFYSFQAGGAKYGHLIFLLLLLAYHPPLLYPVSFCVEISPLLTGNEFAAAADSGKTVAGSTTGAGYHTIIVDGQDVAMKDLKLLPSTGWAGEGMHLVPFPKVWANVFPIMRCMTVRIKGQNAACVSSDL